MLGPFLLNDSYAHAFHGVSRPPIATKLSKIVTDVDGSNKAFSSTLFSIQPILHIFYAHHTPPCR